jgi:arylsulfatase A-like enzyme
VSRPQPPRPATAPRQPFHTWEGLGVALPFYLALFLYALAFHRGFAVMGVKNPELSRITEQYFTGRIILFQAKVLLAYMGCGVLVGVFSGAFIKLARDLLLPSLSRGAAFFLCFLLVAVIHIAFQMKALAQYPQLFDEFYYSRGGFWQWLQLLATDTLGPAPMLWFLRVVLIVFHILLFTRIGIAIYRRRQGKAALIAAGLLVVAVVGLVASRGDRPVAPTKNKGPNLLVIAGDSIRPDHLGFGGSRRDTSPNLDRLARQGAVFERAYAQLPRTFPSWLSFLTGEYPFQHGITTMFPSVKSRQKNFVTLASILRDRGWRTGVVSDFAGDVFSRIQIGFQDVSAPDFNFGVLTEMRGLELHTPLLPYLANSTGRKLFPVLKEFAALADPALLRPEVSDRLAQYAEQDRFFLLVFFSATHFPYAPAYPYYRAYTDPNYRGVYKYFKPNRINLEEKVTAQDEEQVRGLFDGAIRATDDAIGQILRDLDRLGLAQNTLVVYVSDHGENLYEHEYGMGHGEHLRGSHALQLPWLIYDPRQNFPVPRLRGRVRSIDFAPTLLALLGQQPLPDVPGQNLLPRLRGEAPDQDLPVYAETGLWFVETGNGFFQKLRLPYPDVTFICKFEPYYHSEIVLRDEYAPYTETAKHRMLIQGDWKVIYVPLPEGVRWELYNLRDDPEERVNLADREPQQLLEMQTALLDLLRTRPGWTVANGYFLPRPGGLAP